MATRTNVGIKYEQRKEIDEILETKRGKYNSVNDFVQKSVDILLVQEKEKIKTGEEGVEKILEKINTFIKKILEDELEDKIAITRRIAEKIEETLPTLSSFQFTLRHKNKTRILIAAIEIKDSLNDIKEEIMRSNKNFPDDKIPKNYLEEISKLKVKFIESIKNIKK